jgi:type II restriction enzyme
MSSIPEIGKIFYVQDGVAKSKNEVLGKWNKTEFVKTTHDIESKGWMLDVLLCVEKIKKNEFSLDDVYNFEAYLKAKHPFQWHERLEKRQSKALVGCVGKNRLAGQKINWLT